MHHNPLCDELRACMAARYAIREAQGQAASEVARDYLEWLSGQDGVDANLQAAIVQRLNTGAIP